MQQFFLNDVPVHFAQDLAQIAQHKPHFKAFNEDLSISELSASNHEPIIAATGQGLLQLIHAFDQLFATKPPCMHIWLKEAKPNHSFFNQYFKVVSAAGGVVSKGNQILMMERLGKWDLPKGKIEQGESTEIAAVREVAEECGVTTKIIKQLGITWHNYKENGIDCLKKTTWYTMDCLADAAMQPQISEAITQVAWLDKKLQQLALQNTYASIRYVLEQYEALLN